MKKHLTVSIRLTFVTLVLFGVIYPLVITGIARVTASNGGKGKTLEVSGRVYGFEVIGQAFYSDKYFNSRPSAVSYNAAATGGSNKGPSNPEYLALVEERINDFLKHNPTVKREEIPVDLVTASGGGLDPHISLQAAEVQLNRIANARGVSLEVLQTVVKNNTEKPLFGLFGPARFNVLKANLEMENILTHK